MFSTLTITGTWFQQRSIWAVELLRPAGRSQFFLELGLTLAKQLATWWLILTGGWIAVTALVSQATLQGAPFWWCLMGSLLIVLIVFSFGVWIMRYRSATAWLVALIGGLMVTQLLVAVTIIAKLDANVVLVVGMLAAVAISALMIWDAYRRWLTTELG